MANLFATKERAENALAHLEENKLGMRYGSYLILREFLLGCKGALPYERSLVATLERRKPKRRKAKVQ